MVGFVQNMSKPGTLQKHPVTCFYAHKDFRQLYEDQVGAKGRQGNTSFSQTGASVHIDGEEVAVMVADSETSTTTTPRRSWSRGKAVNLFAEFKKSDQADQRITHINENPGKYPWTANSCLLQKNHPQYEHSSCSGEEPAPEDPVVHEDPSNANALPDRIAKQTLAQAMGDL